MKNFKEGSQVGSNQMSNKMKLIHWISIYVLLGDICQKKCVYVKSHISSCRDGKTGAKGTKF